MLVQFGKKYFPLVVLWMILEFGGQFSDFDAVQRFRVHHPYIAADMAVDPIGWHEKENHNLSALSVIRCHRLRRPHREGHYMACE